MKRSQRKIFIVQRKLTFYLFTQGMIAAFLLKSLLQPLPAAAETLTQWKLNGFVELESFVSTYGDQNLKDALKKAEIHNRLEIQYGLENLHLFIRSDLYLLPEFLNGSDPFDYRYSEEETIGRNLRISGQRYDWAFDELYVNCMISPFRLRLGNQIYHWGTADVFNPTAYFNPYDFREFLFRDDDEFRQGVPSLSGMYFSDDFTMELVLSFAHLPMQFASEGNFWSIKMDRSFYTISVKESEGMDVTAANAGIGARMSTNLLNTDISFSIYRGPDREAVQQPTAVEFLPNQPLTIEIDPYYDVITMAGMDFSKAFGDVVFQFEGAYSPDKPNIVMQDLSSPFSVHFPFDIRTSNFVSYAAGFNYYIPLSDFFESHSGEAVFTLDWFQSHFFDEELAKPFLSDILTLRFQDSYFDGRFNIEMTAMFETRYGGSIYWPEVTYDFFNGWTAELAYAAIDGNGGGESIDPLFYHFRNNDILMVRGRYEF